MSIICDKEGMMQESTGDIRLNRIESKIDKFGEDLTIVRIEIGALKVKAGVWGLIAGMIPVGIAFSIWIFTKL
jgi:hypothetical protein